MPSPLSFIQWIQQDLCDQAAKIDDVKTAACMPFFNGVLNPYEWNFVGRKKGMMWAASQTKLQINRISTL